MNETDMKLLIEARQEEVRLYCENISVCHRLIETLPYVWPEHLEPLRHIADRHHAASRIDKLEDVELFSKLVFRDELQAKLRAETFEMTKAKAILDQLESTT